MSWELGLFVIIMAVGRENQDKHLLVFHLVDKAVFLADAARPLSCTVFLQGMGMACACVWMRLQFLQEGFCLLESHRFTFGKFGQAFQSIIRVVETICHNRNALTSPQQIHLVSAA